METDKAPAIGIDLGTTYSVVSVFHNKQVNVLVSDLGQRKTRSSVSFTSTERLIGKAAKTTGTGKNAKNTIYCAKRLIGRYFKDAEVQKDLQHWPFEVVEKDGRIHFKVEYMGKVEYFLPEAISAMVLARMKKVAEDFLGRTVTNAVITVPAYFDDHQRQATKDAARIAGLNVLLVINEPTAAAMAYGLNWGREKRTVLVFDLGGGTLDVSILVIHNGAFRVKATSGNIHLGGEDFDNRLVKHFVEEIKKKCNMDISNDRQKMERLRAACEEAKNTLTDSMEAYVDCPTLFDDLDVDPSITRAQFEHLNADLFLSTLEPVKMALAEAKMTTAHIQDVVIVGGSTRIPKIQEHLKEFFGGKDLRKSVNPDEAIAIGAAVYAAVLNRTAPAEFNDYTLLDVTPFTLGIDTSNGKMSHIVFKNTPVPTFKTERYTTSYDNEPALKIEVFQGESMVPAENKSLGKFILNGIPKAKAKEPKIDVEFRVDLNGILTVEAEVVSVGIKNQMTINTSTTAGRMNEEDFERIIRQAEAFKAEDDRRGARVVAKNDLVNYCYEMSRRFTDVSLNEQVSEGDRKKILDKINDVLRWVKEERLAMKEDFEKKQKELKTECALFLVKLSGAVSSDEY